MKEKFKKLLKLFAVCFMALISCFSIFACDLPFNDDPEQETEQDDKTGGTEDGGKVDDGQEGTGSGTTGGNGDQGTTGATQLTQAEATAKYNEFLAKIASMSPNNGFTIEETIEDSTTVGEFDYSRFDFQAFYEATGGEGTISETQIQEAKDSIAEMMEEFVASSTSIDGVVCSYDATNKVGYQKTFEDGEVTSFYTNVGNTLYKLQHNIEYDGDEGTAVVRKLKYNVDENYYNQYLNFFNNGFDEMLSMMVYDTLEDMQEAMEEELAYEFDLEMTSDNTTFGVTFEEKDGLYELVVSLMVEVDSLTSDEMTMLNATFDTKVTFKADATSIKEISTTTSMSGTIEVNMSEMLEDEELTEGDGEEDGDDAPSFIISIPMETALDAKIFFSGDYDATKAPVFNESEYLGTGTNSAVENNEPEVIVVVDNVDDVAYCAIAKMGGSIEGFTYTDPATGVGYPISSITFYKDKACTQEFTETCPSYDITLYVKHEDVQTVVEAWIAAHPSEGNPGEGGYNPGDGGYNPEEGGNISGDGDGQGEYNPDDGGYENIDYTVTETEWASAIDMSSVDNFRVTINADPIAEGESSRYMIYYFDGEKYYMQLDDVEMFITIENVGSEAKYYLIHNNGNSLIKESITFDDFYNHYLFYVYTLINAFQYSDNYVFDNETNSYNADSVSVGPSSVSNVYLTFENKRLTSLHYEESEGTVTYFIEYDNVEIDLPTEFTEGSMEE